MKIFSVNLAVCVLLIVAGQSSAIELDIVCDIGDGDVFSDGGTGNDGLVGRPGTGGSLPDIHAKSVIYIFELPNLASNESIASANLRFIYTELKGDPEFSADLYGLGWVSSPPVMNPVWYSDAAIDTRTGDDLDTNIGLNQITKIQDDIMTSISAGAVANTPLGAVETDASGQASLSTFLESLYDNGAEAGDFAVLRLNADVEIIDTYPWRGYTVAMAEDTPNAPVLTMNIVPEPGSACLLVLGGLYLMALSRRRS